MTLDARRDDLVPVHECYSADDVRALARQIAARRAMSRATARPRMVPIVALPDPEPEPVKVDIKPPPPVDALSEKVEAARAAIDRGRTSPSYEFVVAIACDCLGLPVDDVMSRSRIKAWAHARHRVLWLVFHITGASLSEIGRRLGGWDHSTIIYALRTVDAARAADPYTAAQLDAIKASIELQWQARKAQVMQ